MTDSKQYKKILKEQLSEITEELSTLGVQDATIAGDWITTPADPIDAEADPNLAADRSEDWQERRAVLSTLETRFNNLRKALQKIEDGTFGVCEICGEKIEADRLDVHPSARTCKAHIEQESELAL